MLCILIGLYKSRSIQTLKEYTLGKNYFPDIVIITTLFATDIDAGSLMGNMGKVYTLGFFFIVARLFSPLCWIIMAKIYGQNIDQFLGLMSVSDIMEKLYGKIGRWMTNIVSIFLSIGVVAMQAIAMGHIASYFFGIGYNQSMIIISVIIALYSSLGGMRAVALTDVFQFAVIMLAIPIACAFAYRDVGGYDGIVNSLPQDMLKLDLNAENIWLFLSLIFYSLLPVNGGPYIQRFLISKNAKQLIKCLKVIAFLYLPFTLIISLIGLIIRIKAPDIDPDAAFIYFISNYVSVGIKGLIVAGLLAVIMSTADSWLNTTSVLFTHDIIGKVIPLTEKQALLMARTFTFLSCILAVELTRYKKALIEIEWLALSFYMPVISIPLLAGFLKFRTNSKSFTAAVTIAILSTAISGYIVGDLATISLMCGMIGSAVGLFGMHYWQVHQGVLNVNTQQTKLTDTAIGKDTDIGSKIALAESQGIHMFEAVEGKTASIVDELRATSFEKGRLVEREEVAKNLLLQGLDISIIENATGISREDLSVLQKKCTRQVHP